MVTPNRPAFGGGGFQLSLTPLVKRMLWVYGGIWFGLVLLTTWTRGEWIPRRIPISVGPEGYEVSTNFDLWSVLALTPPGGATDGPGFHLWQLLTAHFIHRPGDFFGVVLNLLMLVFFAGTVQSFLGSRRFLRVWAAAAIGAPIGGVLFGLLQGASGYEYGIGPGVLTLILVFCAMMPEAVIHLFFVLPIKAKYVGWGTAALVLLGAFATPEAVGGFELGGMTTGFLYYRYGEDLTPRRVRSKLKARRIQKRISNLTVIEGGSKKDDDPPIYH